MFYILLCLITSIKVRTGIKAFVCLHGVIDAVLYLLWPHLFLHCIRREVLMGQNAKYYTVIIKTEKAETVLSVRIPRAKARESSVLVGVLTSATGTDLDVVMRKRKKKEKKKASFLSSMPCSKWPLTSRISKLHQVTCNGM